MKRELLILTGFMGTGKTKIGEIVAKKLGWQFYDLDRLIEKREQMSIAEIFREKGEAYFRRKESLVLKELCEIKQAVLATGGGSLLSSENRQLAEINGLVLCLTTTADEIERRLAGYRDRPLLGPNGTKKKIRELLKERESVYKNFLHQVDTTGLTPDQMAKQILQRFVNFLNVSDR